MVMVVFSVHWPGQGLKLDAPRRESHVTRRSRSSALSSRRVRCFFFLWRFLRWRDFDWGGLTFKSVGEDAADRQNETPACSEGGTPPSPEVWQGLRLAMVTFSRDAAAR